MCLSTPVWHRSRHLLAPSATQPSGPFPWEFPSTRNPLEGGQRAGRAQERSGPSPPANTSNTLPQDCEKVEKRVEWENPCQG